MQRVKRLKSEEFKGRPDPAHQNKSSHYQKFVILSSTMAKNKNRVAAEFDGVFVLKLVLYALLGSLWLKIHRSDLQSGVPLPLGFAVGLVFASHEHFRIDRKIEYALLVLAALVGLIAPYGLFVGF